MMQIQQEKYKLWNLIKRQWWQQLVQENFGNEMTRNYQAHPGQNLTSGTWGGPLVWRGAGMTASKTTFCGWELALDSTDSATGCWLPTPRLTGASATLPSTAALPTRPGVTEVWGFTKEAFELIRVFSAVVNWFIDACILSIISFILDVTRFAWERVYALLDNCSINDFSTSALTRPLLNAGLSELNDESDPKFWLEFEGAMVLAVTTDDGSTLIDRRVSCRLVPLTKSLVKSELKLIILLS